MNTRKKSKPVGNNSKNKPAFKKVKKKVGKQILRSNFTNTQFTSRTIHFPAQHIAHNYNAEAPSNKDDVIIYSINILPFLPQFKHHNLRTRVKALQTVKDNLTKNQDLICTHFTEILHFMKPLFIDIESSVHGFLFALIDLVISHVSAVKFEPHINLISAYIMTGLTHPDAKVNLASVEVLHKLLVAYHKQFMCELPRIFPKLLSLFSSDGGQETFFKNNFRDNAKKITFSQINKNVAKICTSSPFSLISANHNYLQIITTMRICMKLMLEEVFCVNKVSEIEQNNLIEVPSNRMRVFIGKRNIFAKVHMHENKTNLSILAKLEIIYYSGHYLKILLSHWEEKHTHLTPTNSQNVNENIFQIVLNSILTVIDTKHIFNEINSQIVDNEMHDALNVYKIIDCQWFEKFIVFFHTSFPLEDFQNSTRETNNNQQLSICNFNFIHIKLLLLYYMEENHITRIVTQLSKVNDYLSNLLSSIAKYSLDWKTLYEITGEILESVKLCNHSALNCICSHLITIMFEIQWELLQMSNSKDKINIFREFLLNFLKYCSNCLSTYKSHLISTQLEINTGKYLQTTFDTLTIEFLIQPSNSDYISRLIETILRIHRYTSTVANEFNSKFHTFTNRFLPLLLDNSVLNLLPRSLQKQCVSLLYYTPQYYSSCIPQSQSSIVLDILDVLHARINIDPDFVTREFIHFLFGVCTLAYVDNETSGEDLGRSDIIVTPSDISHLKIHSEVVDRIYSLMYTSLRFQHSDTIDISIFMEPMSISKCYISKLYGYLSLAHCVFSVLPKSKLNDTVRCKISQMTLIAFSLSGKYPHFDQIEFLIRHSINIYLSDQKILEILFANFSKNDFCEIFPKTIKLRCILLILNNARIFKLLKQLSPAISNITKEIKELELIDPMLFSEFSSCLEKII